MKKVNNTTHQSKSPFEEVIEKLSPVILYLSMLEAGEYGSLNNIQVRKIKQAKHYALRALQHIESYNQKIPKKIEV